MPEPEVVATISRWEWDRSREAAERVLGRVRVVTWVSAALIGVPLAATGLLMASGTWRLSSVVYGLAAGVAGGYLTRGIYVASQVRRAVAPLRGAVVPKAAEQASVAQLCSLLVNGGSMVEPYLLLKAVPGDAVVEITREDLADRPFPRPGFFQLLLTGPDGTYYDDGSGTMDDAGRDVGGGFDGGGFVGGGFDGGGGGS